MGRRSAGIFVHTVIVHSLFDRAAAQVLHFIINFGMICYMFVLGIEMDPYVLLRAPTREAKVAYAGVLSAFIIAYSIQSLYIYLIYFLLLGL
jgi:Kef-type K+ transport system membrane component KefB